MTAPQTESVILALTIQQQRSGVDFYVMQTPLPLWEALPQKAEFIEADYTKHAHYFKRFVLKVARKVFGVGLTKKPPNFGTFLGNIFILMQRYTKVTFYLDALRPTQIKRQPLEFFLKK